MKADGLGTTSFLSHTQSQSKIGLNLWHILLDIGLVSSYIRFNQKFADNVISRTWTYRDEIPKLMQQIFTKDSEKPGMAVQNGTKLHYVDWERAELRRMTGLQESSVKL
jgi:hypothetical protein